MDVDLLDPTTKIREMFIKLPDDVVDTYAHLNDHFNCPEYAQDVYCYRDVFEIVLKVALNTITLTLNFIISNSLEWEI
jgi:hypothetical protein